MGDRVEVGVHHAQALVDHDAGGHQAGRDHARRPVERRGRDGVHAVGALAEVLVDARRTQLVVALDARHRRVHRQAEELEQLLERVETREERARSLLGAVERRLHRLLVHRVGVGHAVADGLVLDHLGPRRVEDLVGDLAGLADDLVGEGLPVAVLVHVALALGVQAQRRGVADAHHVGEGVVHVGMRGGLHHAARPDGHFVPVAVGGLDGDRLPAAVPVELRAQGLHHVDVVAVVARREDDAARRLVLDVRAVGRLRIDARHRACLVLGEKDRLRRERVIGTFVDRLLVLLGHRGDPVDELDARAVLFAQLVGVVIAFGVGPELEEVGVRVVEDLGEPVERRTALVGPLVPQALVGAVAHPAADLVDNLVRVVDGAQLLLVARVEGPEHQAAHRDGLRLLDHGHAGPRLGGGARSGDAGDAGADHDHVGRLDRRAVGVAHDGRLAEPVAGLERFGRARILLGGSGRLGRVLTGPFVGGSLPFRFLGTGSPGAQHPGAGDPEADSRQKRPAVERRNLLAHMHPPCRRLPAPGAGLAPGVPSRPRCAKV